MALFLEALLDAEQELLVFSLTNSCVEQMKNKSQEKQTYRSSTDVSIWSVQRHFFPFDMNAALACMLTRKFTEL